MMVFNSNRLSSSHITQRDHIILIITQKRHILTVTCSLLQRVFWSPQTLNINPWHNSIHYYKMALLCIIHSSGCPVHLELAGATIDHTIVQFWP